MAETLREARQRLGIGIRRLSKGAPVAPRTIYGIENGDSTPNPETIRKISRFLGLEPMEVEDFRRALEAQGLSELPEEIPPPHVAAGQSFESAGWSVRESSPYADYREEALARLRELMQDLGRLDSERIFREVFGAPPGGHG